MSAPARILAFAGSLRRASWNKKLVRIAADGARAAGAEVTLLDLADLPMPVFDEDLEKEKGLDPNARRFKDLLLAHGGLLIAAPEYNSSITAALKNAIDWASRPAPGEKPLACFEGKVAGLMAASPGALGGLRGLVTVRSILGNIKTLVIPEQIAITKAHEAFDSEGRLVDDRQRASVEAVGARVAELTARLRVD